MPKKKAIARKAKAAVKPRNPNDATFRNIDALKTKLSTLDHDTAAQFVSLMKMINDQFEVFNGRYDTLTDKVADLEFNRKQTTIDLALHDQTLSTLIDQIAEVNTLLDLNEGAA